MSNTEKEKTLYELLSVKPDATLEEIRVAYRRKAMRYHPDRENGDEAHFKRVKDAYEILSDPDRRKRYDETGETEERKTPVEEMLNSLVETVLAEIDTKAVKYIDVVEIFRSCVQREIKSVGRKKKELLEDGDKFEEIRARISSTSEKATNIFLSVVDRNINTINHKLNHLEDIETYLHEVNTLVDTYVYNVDEMSYGYEDEAIYGLPVNLRNLLKDFNP